MIWKLRVLGIALYSVGMLGVYHLLKWGLTTFGLTFLIPFFLVFFAIGWWMEPRWSWSNDD